MDKALAILEAIKRFSKDGITILLSSFAAIILVVAAIAAVTRNIDVSVALMAIFVISVLTIALPRLRALEAFGVKAQLDEQIKKAEVTLDQLKSLARASARHAFLQMRSVSIAGQTDVIASLNESMTAAVLTEAEATELRRPLMENVAGDLFNIVQAAAVHLKSQACQTTNDKLQALGAPVLNASDPDQSGRDHLKQEYDRLLKLKIPEDRQPATPDNLTSLLDSCLANFPRSDDESRRLRNLIANARRIMDECLEKKTLAPDFTAFTSHKSRFGGGFVAPDPSIAARAILQSRFAEAP